MWHICNRHWVPRECRRLWVGGLSGLLMAGMTFDKAEASSEFGATRSGGGIGNSVCIRGYREGRRFMGRWPPIVLVADMVSGSAVSLPLSSPTCSFPWCGLHLIRVCLPELGWGYGNGLPGGEGSSDNRLGLWEPHLGNESYQGRRPTCFSGSVNLFFKELNTNYIYSIF